MRARFWLGGFAIVATAVGLVAINGVTASSPKGGTLRISNGRDLDSIDPALAYNVGSWGFEYVTCAKLYNYPDKPAPAGATVVPEVATNFPMVSAAGRTQTIQLRRTFRFHNGQPVTAANYVAAFNRDANPKLQSPATYYLHDVAGADAVIDGRARTISGVRAISRYTLRITTTKSVRDLVSRLALPFSCPIAVGTPPSEIDDPLGSGPYYIASRVPNRQMVLERNPYYRGSRPANVDRIVYSITPVGDCVNLVEQNAMDYCLTMPPTRLPELVTKYGINRPNGRFFFNPTLGIEYFAFNHDRAAFKGLGQISLEKAVNWAIDRHALAEAAGYLRGKRTDQILPPAMTRPASIYPLGGVTKRRLARARSLLARAAVKPSKLVIYVDNFPGYHLAWAQILRFDLRRLGIDVEIKVFPRSGYFDLIGARGAPYDIAIGGWVPDYADPVTIFGPLLDGKNLTKTGNDNVAYFDRAKYNRAIERIASLGGDARQTAWANLDVEMMRDDPPWAPVLVDTDVEFVSKSFGCYVFQPVVSAPDYAAACKK
jgi:ABC-type transport system substrate-binding protein